MSHLYAFSDIESTKYESSLYDVEIVAVRRCLSHVNFSLRMRSFGHITTSGLKSDVIFEFSAPVFLQRRGHFGRAIPFSSTCMTIMSSRAQ